MTICCVLRWRTAATRSASPLSSSRALSITQPPTGRRSMRLSIVEIVLDRCIHEVARFAADDARLMLAGCRLCICGYFAPPPQRRGEHRHFAAKIACDARPPAGILLRPCKQLTRISSHDTQGPSRDRALADRRHFRHFARGHDGGAVVTAEVSDGAATGRAECRPYARYGETPESVVAAIRAAAPRTSPTAKRFAGKCRRGQPAMRSTVRCGTWRRSATACRPGRAPACSR